MKASMDSSSLIFILKIPKLFDLANNYFDEICITDEVYNEVFNVRFSEEVAQVRQVMARLCRKNPKKMLGTKLGKGELSGISLAREEKILFVSEDKKAIAFARSIGVKFTSILSLIIRARTERRLSVKEARGLLFDLVEKGFYMSPELLSSIIEKLEGRL